MNVLDCESCPVSLHPDAEIAAERICPVVSGKVLSRLGSLGLGTSVDAINRTQLLTNALEQPAGQHEAESACQDRLLQLENTNRGYSTMSY